MLGHGTVKYSPTRNPTNSSTPAQHDTSYIKYSFIYIVVLHGHTRLWIGCTYLSMNVVLVVLVVLFVVPRDILLVRRMYSYSCLFSNEMYVLIFRGHTYYASNVTLLLQRESLTKSAKNTESDFFFFPLIPWSIIFSHTWKSLSPSIINRISLPNSSVVYCSVVPS